MSTVINLTKSMVRNTKALAKYLAFIALPLGFPLGTFAVMRLTYIGF